MKLIKKILILTCVWILPQISCAELSFFDAQFSELAVSARALGMGNAYIAKSNDSSSVFYNPAGLGSVRDWKLHVSNVFVEWNKNWQSASSGGKIADAASNFTEAFSMDGLRKISEGSYNSPTYSRFSINPHLTTRYFSLGYLYAMKTRTQVVESDSGDQFEYADRTDHGPYVAGSFSLFGGILKFGAMGMLLLRSEAFGSQDYEETVNLTDDDYKSGMSPIINGGVKLTLPIVALPTFAARFNNVNSAKFHGSAGTTPEKIKNSIDLGFSITPKIGNAVNWHMEVNYKDVTEKFPDLATVRRIQAGMEIAIARIIYFRTGLADGFGSFGLGMRSKRLEVDISSYSLDLTDNDLRGEEDRRFTLSISSGL